MAQMDPRVSWAMEYLLAILDYIGLGSGVRVTSTVRSTEKQAALYAEWQAGKRKLPVAPPGRSKHERGLAFDITGPIDTLRMAGQIAPYLGLRWLGERDPVHFEAL